MIDYFYYCSMNNPKESEQAVMANFAILFSAD